MMLCQRLLRRAAVVGRATKYTFAQGHGLTKEDVLHMEKERQGLLGRLCDTDKNEWFIPSHIQVGQGFSYETELFSFLQRIGSSEPYVLEQARASGTVSALSSALVVVLSHHSSCHSQEILDLKDHICNLGKLKLSQSIMSYFAGVFPNISSDILYKLSLPTTCMSSARCFSLFKHMCLHELIRNRSEESLTLEEYVDVAGGVFLCLLMFDKYGQSALRFLRSFILNYYSNIDFRDLVDYEDIKTAEEKLGEFLVMKNMASPQIRVISIDGEDTNLPLYNIGIFCEEECIATAAENSVESATLAACNAALTSFIFSDRNFGISIDSYDFTSVSSDMQQELEYVETQLKRILGGVDLSKAELDKSNQCGDRIIVNHDWDYRAVQKLRRLRYKSRNDIAS